MNDPMIKEMEAAYATVVPEKGDTYEERMKDADRNREETREAIARVVQKYFPPGMEVEVALKQLHEKGFEIEEYVDTRVRSWPVGEFRQHWAMQGRPIPKGQKKYLASQNYDFIIKIPATKEARIIIESDGERIIKTNGYIFLHGI